MAMASPPPLSPGHSTTRRYSLHITLTHTHTHLVYSLFVCFDLAYTNKCLLLQVLTTPHVHVCMCIHCICTCTYMYVPHTPTLYYAHIYTTPCTCILYYMYMYIYVATPYSTCINFVGSCLATKMLKAHISKLKW